MNRSEKVARVAARMGLGKFTVEGAVDTVLEGIAEGLAKAEDAGVAGYGTLRSRGRAGIHGRRERGYTFEAGYRKSGLLDRFLSFDVRFARDRPAGH